ncbi:MAG TPA: aminofutalosine synthase MqnE [Acidobacteriota bacterium]
MTIDRRQFRGFLDPALAPIADKLAAGERLAREDGLALLDSPDLLGVGRLANAVKEARSGPYAFFVLNRQINPTNVCVISCKFCDFAAKAGDDDAYEMTMAEILDKVREPIHEVHLVGGLHPTWPFEYYEEMLRAIRRANPDAQIKAFTAVEIDFFAGIARIPVDEVLDRLVAAGLDTMPGGGAEVFSERVRKALYREKIGADRWLQIHRIAHGKGIRTNATLLYGHIETHAERVDHLLRLRELQDDTGGFFSFIPLEFQPGYTNLVARQASALDGLKTIAASRLLLDNFAHIKAYWVMLGEETASMALQWGADDLDGTIGEEKIAHAALASSPLGLTAHRMLKLLREAGRVPVQRDARYRALTVFPAPPAPTHWSQRGIREIDAAIPRKIDPAAADANAVSLEGEELYTWDLAAIGPEVLARRGRSLDPDDLAAAGFAPPAAGSGGGLAKEASA